MKKNIVIALFVAVISLYSGGRQAIEPVSSGNTPQVFFVDRRLHRLISLDFPEKGSPDAICRKMVKELIIGRDNNEEILRIIPKEPGIISVNVKKNAAYVDLSKDIFAKIEKNPENERLIIYQIVNSLASVDGIDRVLFTIDGKVEKDFMGYMDMREIFTPNYDI